MWLIANCGFYSIVEKPWDREAGTLTVRARVLSDLDGLREQYLPDLSATSEDPMADYRFRGTAPRQSVEKAVAAITADIRYENFKDEVSRLQGDERAIVYHHVWAALARLQPRTPVKADIPVIYASIGNRPDILDTDDIPLPRDPSKRRT